MCCEVIRYGLSNQSVLSCVYGFNKQLLSIKHGEDEDREVGREKKKIVPKSESLRGYSYC